MNAILTRRNSHPVQDNAGSACSSPNASVPKLDILHRSGVRDVVALLDSGDEILLILDCEVARLSHHSASAARIVASTMIAEAARLLSPRNLQSRARPFGDVGRSPRLQRIYAAQGLVTGGQSAAFVRAILASNNSNKRQPWGEPP